MEARKRCVAYVRVSTEKQAGEDKTSLATQLQACWHLAEQHGWAVVEEISDEATGYSLDRPGLDRARTMAKAGEFDLVVALKQERLSRSQVDMGILSRELAKADVGIWTVQEGRFEDTPLGRFITQTHAFVAEMDREQRREATMRGQKGKAERGHLLGSSPKAAYGYRWPEDERRDDGRLLKHRYEEDPETADVVRQMYAWALAGVSLSRIARRLNEAGIPSPYGKLAGYTTSGCWQHQTVKGVLANRMYRGEAVALALHSRKPGRDSKRHEPVPLPEGVVPALVSSATWDRVQSILAEQLNRQTRVAVPEEVLLRGGIVRCGNCGRAMRIAKRGNGNRYYQCNKMSREAHTCPRPSPSIKTSYIEEPVWAAVKAILLDPAKIWDRFHSTEQQDQEAVLLAECRKQLGQVEARRKTLLRNLELLAEIDVAEIKPRLDELAAEREALAGQIAALEGRAASRERGREHLSRLLSWARSEVERVDGLSTEERRAVLLELGVVVRVFPTGAADRYTFELGVKLKPEPETFFEGVDWSDVGPPTRQQREETEREFAEAATRGRESDIIGTLMEGAGSADREYPWSYWDEHVQEALVQHAGVLGIQPVTA